MRDKPRSTTRRALRAIGAVLAAGVGLAALYSCSLIVDTQSQQCTKDSDCAMFGDAAKCNTSAGGVCECTGMSCTLTASSGTTTSTSTSTTTSTSTSTTTTTTTSTSTTTSSTSSTSSGSPCDVDGGIAAGGCYNDSLAMCPATTNSELLNACTTGCIGFDNATRVPGLLPGGKLPQLPANGPDGGF